MKGSLQLSLRFIALILACLLSHQAFATDLTLSSVSIHVLNDNYRSEEIKKIIPFTIGQKVSEEDVAHQMREIEELENIESATYKFVPEGKGHRLEIEILEYEIIRDIFVAGNYPFLNRDFTRLIPLQSGTVYDPILIPKAIGSIDAFLSKNGYYDSTIAITAEPHHKYDTVDLKIKIHKGHTYRVDKIIINGTKNLSEKTIRNKLSRSSRFRMVKLKNNLHKIKKLYTKKGFIKARVKLDKVIFHDNTKTADIHISIKENKRLILRFEGKPVFKKSSLTQILNFEEQRSYDRYSIQISRVRLERFYRQSGYPDAIIRHRLFKTDDKVRVTYHVTPGKRVELAKIRFEGNKKFGTKHLKKRMTSEESKLMQRGQFRITRLLSDVMRLKDYYQSKGYLNADVTNPEITTNHYGDQKTATYRIQEGELYRFSNVRAVSDLDYDTEKLLKVANLKEKDDFTKERLDKAKVKVFETIFADGYAYATVEFKGHIDQEAKTVDLTINVQRGDKVHLRHIAVEGNNLTRTKTILSHIKMKEGDAFVYQKVLDAQLNLRSLGIFSTVKIEALGLENKAHEIDLHVFVNELKTNLAKIQAGFDNRTMARGEVSYTRRNLFGRAKQFNTRFIGGKKFNRGELTFFSPRVFGASWNLANQYFGQFEDAPNFNAYSYGGFVNTLKNFGPYWTFGFKEGVTRTEVLETESNIALLGDALFDNTFNEAGLFAIFDNRDNFSDPQRGFYILVRNDINTDLSDFTNNFDTARVNVNHHYGFLGRFTLNNTLRYGHNFKISENPRIPVNKLFFMGGADTVRGFDEDAMDASGGTFSFIYNAELNFRIYDAFKIASFFDAGVLGDNVNAMSWGDVRESAGLGIRYFTPVGPVRLDWGFILDRRPGEPTSNLHFSFGYFF